MKSNFDLVTVLKWIVGACLTIATAVFAIMKFAYSDFDTIRTNEVYKQGVEREFQSIHTQQSETNRRLDIIHGDIGRLDQKIDRVLLKDLKDH